jgi:hypothetical protein
MSFIKDVFFGGAEQDAARVQADALEQSQLFTREGVDQARSDVNQLFPAATQNANQGFQGALDIFGQSAPAQLNALQGGNVAAQNQILAGMPQFQNAILGNQVDTSQFQPFQGSGQDLGFLQQQLPETIDPFAPMTPEETQLATANQPPRPTGLPPIPPVGTITPPQNIFGPNPLGGNQGNFNRFNLGGRF